MMTWLMLQVPAMIEALPVRVTPEPSARGNDVEETADHRCSGRKPGLRRHLFRDRAGNIGAFDQRAAGGPGNRQGHRPPSAPAS